MYNPEIVSCGKVIAIHSFESRQPISVYNPHRGLINCVSINHSNRVIASCGQDGKIFLVAADKPQTIVHEQPFSSQKEKNSSVNCCMFSPNSSYIAAGSVDSVVKVWNMKNTKQTHSIFKSHIGSITSLGWIKNLNGVSTQGEILASSSSIGDIYLHSIKTNTVLETLTAKYQEGVNSIRVSESDQHNRLAACTNGGSVMVWDLNCASKQSGLICNFSNTNKASVTCISFSSFNPVLLVTSSVDENLVFYDINEKRSVKVISTEEPLTAVNFHSNGHTLVAGGMYGGLFVYDLRKPNKPKEKLIGHQTTVKFLDFYKEKEIKDVDKKEFTSSRASKVSSVSSQGSMNSQSLNTQSTNNAKTPEIVQNEVIKNNRQIYMPVEVKVNNFTNTTNSTLQNASLKEKRISDNKLSLTGQQVIKNSAILKQNEREVTGLSQQLKLDGSSSDFNKSKPKQPFPRIINPQMSGSDFYRPPVTTQKMENKVEIRDLQRRIVSEMHELFEDMHLQMIRQFQIQSQQQKKMIQDIILKDKKKDMKILQLQEQIKKLRKQTF